MAVNLSRNTRLYITTADLCTETEPVFTEADTWEVEILDGYSFTQTTEATVIQLSEAGDTPSRGQRSFNTRRNPVEWSFSTYLRPYRVTAGTQATTDDTADAPELKLWSALMSDSLTAYTSTTGATPVASLTTTGSDKHQLAEFGLIFLVDQVAYAVPHAAINTAEITFDLTGIATVAWSGMGTVLRKLASTNITATPLPSVLAPNGACGGSKSYITNKLSTIELASGFTGGTTYSVPITGGTFTYTNNIEYVTPDTLGSVDAPIGYFTGTRAISGNVTAYLRTGSSTDTGALLADALANSLTPEPKYRMKLNIGGVTEGTPRVVMDMPFTTLQIPSVDIQEVVSTTINFTAQGTTAGNFDAAANNELTVQYKVA